MGDYKANEQDQKRAENIRRQYVSHEDNKMEQLQKMDSKVKLPGMIASLAAYPTYALVTDRRKKMYASDIMRMSDELIKE